MAPTHTQLLGAQRLWQQAGVYSGPLDGEWGPLSIAANRKIAWPKALQTYLQSRGWYRGKIDGVIGAFTQLATAQFERELEDQSLVANDQRVGHFGSNLARWNACKITDPGRFGWAVKGCLANKIRYQVVERQTRVPWAVVAVIHCREASFNFKAHLHNGDPLSARTVHVPAGRPFTGVPPFTWEASAVDALVYDHFAGKTDWSISTTLDRLEAYNGVGYRKRGLPSPYLWAGTDQYVSGKYVEDGIFSASTVDQQPGCAGILKLLGVA